MLERNEIPIDIGSATLSSGMQLAGLVRRMHNQLKEQRIEAALESYEDFRELYASKETMGKEYFKLKIGDLMKRYCADVDNSYTEVFARE